MNITLLKFDTIDSTNTEALKQAKLGADEGLCIVADQQTAGRGRHGRTWVSEKGSGLYFSIVLRPKIDTQYLPLITLMTGVAVHDTLEEFGVDADIKWVNDLLIDEKKICGILAETTETDKGLAVVVGIGINIKSSNFPPEIADIATSIEELQKPARKQGRNGQVGDHALANARASALAESLTKYLTYFYTILNDVEGPATIIEEWRKRSSYYEGKAVRIIVGEETLEGVTDGLEKNGALRLIKNDGTVAIIQAGDVQRLRSSAQ